jgi:phenylacetate-CoA ligase
VLLAKGYPANYQIIVSREHNSDKLEVQVEMTPEIFSDTLSAVSSRERELIEALKAMLGIYARCVWWHPRASPAARAKRCASSTNANCINSI